MKFDNAAVIKAHVFALRTRERERINNIAGCSNLVLYETQKYMKFGDAEVVVTKTHRAHVKKGEKSVDVAISLYRNLKSKLNSVML